MNLTLSYSAACAVYHTTEISLSLCTRKSVVCVLLFVSEPEPGEWANLISHTLFGLMEINAVIGLTIFYLFLYITHQWDYYCLDNGML